MGDTRPGAPGFPHTAYQGAKTPPPPKEEHGFTDAEVRKALGQYRPPKEKTQLPWLNPPAGSTPADEEPSSPA